MVARARFVPITVSRFLGKMARRVLILVILLGEVAADLAKPIRLDRSVVLLDLDLMLGTNGDQAHAVGRVLALRVDADLAFQRFLKSLASGVSISSNQFAVACMLLSAGGLNRLCSKPSMTLIDEPIGKLSLAAAACSKNESWAAPTLIVRIQSGLAFWMFWIVCANWDTPSGMNSSPTTSPPRSFMILRF